MKRLKSGFLLKEIFDRFGNKASSLLPDQLMQIYSGHDITIASLLNSLGVFDVNILSFYLTLIQSKDCFFNVTCALFSGAFPRIHPHYCLSYTKQMAANTFDYFIKIP